MNLPSRRRFLRSTSGLLSLAAAPSLAAGPQRTRSTQTRPPVARVDPLNETYFGATVTDPYRWMENPSDPEWMPFLRAQSAYARKILDAIPGRKQLGERVAELSAGTERFESLQAAGPWVFTTRRPAGSSVFRLYVRRGLDGSERLLVDPDKRRRGEEHFALNYWLAAPDGKHVLYGMSASGSEQSVIEVMEVATGRILPERIDRTQYAAPSWLPDGSGFFYNRLAEGVKAGSTDFYKNSVCWLHRLGTDPSKDVKVLSRGQFADVPVNDIDFPSVATQPDSDQVLGLLFAGVQREVVVFVNSLSNAGAGSSGWKQVCSADDQVTAVTFRGNDIFLITEKGAPLGRVLHVRADAPALSGAREILPQGSIALRSLFAARDGIYVTALDAAYSRLYRLSGRPDDKPQAIALPYDGALYSPFADPTVDGLLFALQGWVRPEQVWKVAAEGKASATRIVKAPPIDIRPYETQVTYATARDGTRIPVSLVYRRGLKRDGSAPALVQAYGAYAVTSEPFFAPRFIAWLERGGIFATAHVRGGGEYGRAWHEAGRLLTKPNTWRDLIAACEMLVAEKWTRPARLSINGGSAGGIAVSMAMIERPDLFAAVISEVGLSNALRFEFSQNGPPNIPEFGSVQTEEGFKALYAMDAYRQVRDGTAYPAVLLTSGANDPRVDPWQAGKMAARLQAANGARKPILLRVEFQGGHGLGSTRQQVDAEIADVLGFALWQSR